MTILRRVIVEKCLPFFSSWKICGRRGDVSPLKWGNIFLCFWGRIFYLYVYELFIFMSLILMCITLTVTFQSSSVFCVVCSKKDLCSNHITHVLVSWLWWPRKGWNHEKQSLVHFVYDSRKKFLFSFSKLNDDEYLWKKGHKLFILICCFYMKRRASESHM